MFARVRIIYIGLKDIFVLLLLLLLLLSLAKMDDLMQQIILL